MSRPGMFFIVTLFICAFATLPSVSAQGLPSDGQTKEALRTIGQFLRSEPGTRWLSELAKTLSSPLTTIELMKALRTKSKAETAVLSAAEMVEQTLEAKIRAGSSDGSSEVHGDELDTLLADIQKQNDIICLYRKDGETAAKRDEDWRNFLKSMPSEYTLYLALDKGNKYFICLKKIKVPKFESTTTSSGLPVEPRFLTSTTMQRPPQGGFDSQSSGLETTEGALNAARSMDTPTTTEISSGSRSLGNAECDDNGRGGKPLRPEMMPMRLPPAKECRPIVLMMTNGNYGQLPDCYSLLANLCRGSCGSSNLGFQGHFHYPHQPISGNKYQGSWQNYLWLKYAEYLAEKEKLRQYHKHLGTLGSLDQNLHNWPRPNQKIPHEIWDYKKEEADYYQKQQAKFEKIKRYQEYLRLVNAMNHQNLYYPQGMGQGHQSQIRPTLGVRPEGYFTSKENSGELQTESQNSNYNINQLVTKPYPVENIPQQPYPGDYWGHAEHQRPVYPGVTSPSSIQTNLQNENINVNWNQRPHAPIFPGDQVAPISVYQDKVPCATTCCTGCGCDKPIKLQIQIQGPVNSPVRLGVSSLDERIELVGARSDPMTQESQIGMRNLPTNLKKSESTKNATTEKTATSEAPMNSTVGNSTIATPIVTTTELAGSSSPSGQ